MGDICDNSLPVGDIYVHDKETRPLYVKFTMSFLMSSVSLGLQNCLSYRINSSCLAISLWELWRTAPGVCVAVGAAGGCGAGHPQRHRTGGCCWPWARGSQNGSGQQLLLLDWVQQHGCSAWGRLRWDLIAVYSFPTRKRGGADLFSVLTNDRKVVSGKIYVRY